MGYYYHPHFTSKETEAETPPRPHDYCTRVGIRTQACWIPSSVGMAVACHVTGKVKLSYSILKPKGNPGSGASQWFSAPC